MIKTLIYDVSNVNKRVIPTMNKPSNAANKTPVMPDNRYSTWARYYAKKVGLKYETVYAYVAKYELPYLIVQVSNTNRKFYTTQKFVNFMESRISRIKRGEELQKIFHVRALEKERDEDTTFDPMTCTREELENAVKAAKTLAKKNYLMGIIHARIYYANLQNSQHELQSPDSATTVKAVNHFDER